MAFHLDDVRRLTGPNLLMDSAGAIIDVLFDDADPQLVYGQWQHHLRRCVEHLDIEVSATSYCRFYQGGASFAVPASVDMLYGTCDLLELAWELCVENLMLTDEQQKSNPVDFSARIAQINMQIKTERRPELLSLMQRAAQHSVLCLVDDDDLSLGSGKSTQCWPLDSLPSPQSIDYDGFSKIPVALITGTNGKSTSVRLAAQIASSAGLTAGLTSTDFIKVGDDVIDQGDYSGPGGARMLLRDPRADIAFLEVARGGLLRRGLPLNYANAALITNIASDHLGQYGINTLDDITQVKMLVAKAMRAKNKHESCVSDKGRNDEALTSVLVLNADDERLLAAGQALTQELNICWFSTDAHHPSIVNALAQGEPCVYLQNDCLHYAHNHQITHFGHIQDMPMTLMGSALHNVQNALGVIGLCKAMSIADEAVEKGLKEFAKDASDNPGRGNLYQYNGATVIVDFAHNTHSMQAVIDMANKLAAQMQHEHPNMQKHVMFSHAGDRSNQDIIDVTHAVTAFSANRYVLAEIEHYLRGRQLGEVSTIVTDALLSRGIDKTQIVSASSPEAGAQATISRLVPGDLALLFVLDEREQVRALLD
ncbi:Mur ligase family protein [Glaciecola siphonariae]|uniref:Mur ligase family protein n=1 Tax=Glaciecola siphonariae TaxID=521012 RepID=A0ABV9LSP3_9ALTE